MYSLSIRPCKKTVKKEQERGLHLDPLLDDEGAGLEPLVELLHHLGDELVVVQLLPALHDPHDARLDLVFPVLVHLVCKCRSVQVYKCTSVQVYKCTRELSKSNISPSSWSRSSQARPRLPGRSPGGKYW